MKNLSALSAAKIVKILDIWHDDAFIGTPAHGLGSNGERQEKWYAEDSWGNVIAEYLGKVPDGAVSGEFKDGEFYWIYGE